MHRRPKLRLFEAGRFRLRIWVRNDRKKIRLHRKAAFWRGSVFYYPKRPFERLTGGGANIWCSIDVQPQISRFRGRDPPPNDRMVPNYPRVPVHVPACSRRKLIWNMRAKVKTAQIGAREFPLDLSKTPGIAFGGFLRRLFSSTVVTGPPSSVFVVAEAGLRSRPSDQVKRIPG